MQQVTEQQSIKILTKLWHKSGEQHGDQQNGRGQSTCQYQKEKSFIGNINLGRTCRLLTQLYVNWIYYVALL